MPPKRKVIADPEEEEEAQVETDEPAAEPAADEAEAAAEPAAEPAADGDEDDEDGDEASAAEGGGKKKAKKIAKPKAEPKCMSNKDGEQERLEAAGWPLIKKCRLWPKGDKDGENVFGYVVSAPWARPKKGPESIVWLGQCQTSKVKLPNIPTPFEVVDPAVWDFRVARPLSMLSFDAEADEYPDLALAMEKMTATTGDGEYWRNAYINRQSEATWDALVTIAKPTDEQLEAGFPQDHFLFEVLPAPAVAAPAKPKPKAAAPAPKVIKPTATAAKPPAKPAVAKPTGKPSAKPAAKLPAKPAVGKKTPAPKPPAAKKQKVDTTERKASLIKVGKIIQEKRTAKIQQNLNDIDVDIASLQIPGDAAIETMIKQAYGGMMMFANAMHTFAMQNMAVNHPKEPSNFLKAFDYAIQNPKSNLAFEVQSVLPTIPMVQQVLKKGGTPAQQRQALLQTDQKLLNDKLDDVFHGIDNRYLKELRGVYSPPRPVAAAPMEDDDDAGDVAAAAEGEETEVDADGAAAAGGAGGLADAALNGE